MRGYRRSRHLEKLRMATRNTDRTGRMFQSSPQVVQKVGSSNSTDCFLSLFLILLSKPFTLYAVAAFDQREDQEAEEKINESYHPVETYKYIY